MKSLRLLLVLALAFVPSASCGPAPTAELFPTAVAVKAYMFEGEEPGRGVFYDFRTLDPSAVPAHGVLLSPAQVARVKRTFAAPTGEQGASACFNPRHGFVFYDAKGEVVGTLDICFECTNFSVNAPGYDARVQPVYDRFKQPEGEWDEKLHKQAMVEVNRVRAGYGMPVVDPPVDWKGLEALVRELGMPPKPAAADFARVRAMAN